MPRIAAIGPRTAEAVGAAPTWCPAVSTQEGLLAELPRPAGRVLFAAGEGARRVLPDALGADVVPLYRTRELRPDELPVGRSLRAGLGLGGERARAARTRSSGRLDRTRRPRERPGTGRVDVVAEAAEHTTDGIAAAVGAGRPSRMSVRGVDSGAGVHHVPHRLRAPGRLRRHLPRRDQAHRPGAQIIDITHGIPPQAVLQGALVLANTLPYMPVGVHLAVVDPGVGSHRRAARAARRRGPALRRPGQRAPPPGGRARRASPTRTSSRTPRMRSSSVSRTFHGRDLFSPAAAHLASGVPIGELGPPIDPEALVRLDLPRALVRRWGRPRDDAVRRQLRQHRAEPDARRSRAVGVVPGRRSSWSLAASATTRSSARTFADARAGDVILYEDSYRQHVDRDLERQRGGDAPCHGRQADQHPGPLTRPADDADWGP